MTEAHSCSALSCTLDPSLGPVVNARFVEGDLANPALHRTQFIICCEQAEQGSVVACLPSATQKQCVVTFAVIESGSRQPWHGVESSYGSLQV